MAISTISTYPKFKFLKNPQNNYFGPMCGAGVGFLFIIRFRLEINLIPTPTKFFEVRDSRTGYLVPVRYGLGVWPDWRVVGAPSPPSPSASVGNSIPKYINFDICSEISSSGPSHQIRLVKLVSNFPTRAKVNRKFGPKSIFYMKNR